MAGNQNTQNEFKRPTLQALILLSESIGHLKQAEATTRTDPPQHLAILDALTLADNLHKQLTAIDKAEMKKL